MTFTCPSVERHRRYAEDGLAHDSVKVAQKNNTQRKKNGHLFRIWGASLLLSSSHLFSFFFATPLCFERLRFFLVCLCCVFPLAVTSSVQKWVTTPEGANGRWRETVHVTLPWRRLAWYLT